MRWVAPSGPHCQMGIVSHWLGRGRVIENGAGDREEERRKWRLPVLEGILPLDRKRIPTDLIAGATLAALAIPEVMGYTKIAGMPVITGLYTILIPIAVFALLGSSRHLVVGADSATAAILFAGLDRPRGRADSAAVGRARRLARHSDRRVPDSRAACSSSGSSPTSSRGPC